MRILAVGLVTETVDEGFKKVASEHVRRLAKQHEVMAVRTGELAHAAKRREVAAFAPEVTHVFSAPTLRALALVRSLPRRARGRVVATTLHPYCLHLASGLQRTALRICRPDVAIVQSSAAASLFRGVGSSVRYVSNGVDRARFAPVSTTRKGELRAELGLAGERPLVLHVGHLTKERMLTRLEPIAEEFDVLVVAGAHFAEEPGLRARLEARGIRVWSRYIPEIQRVYQASDLYVFPVDDGKSIFQPLSVLEALACGVPVVAMPYASLTEWAQGDPAVNFAQPHELLAAAQRVVREQQRPRADLVPDWNDVVSQVVEAYRA